MLGISSRSGALQVIRNVSICDSHIKDNKQSLLRIPVGRIIYTELAVKVIVTFLVDPGRRLIKRMFYRFKHIRPLGRLRFGVVRNSIDVSGLFYDGRYRSVYSFA